MATIARPRVEQFGKSQWSAVRIVDNWMLEAFARIGSLRGLRSGWDTRSAIPITDEAENTARGLISFVCWWEGMPAPMIVALPDGGIGMHWNVGLRDLELEIDGGGEVTYAQTESGNVYSGQVTSKNAQKVINWVVEA